MSDVLRHDPDQRRRARVLRAHAGTRYSRDRFLAALAWLGATVIEAMARMPTGEGALGSGRVREDGVRIRPACRFEATMPGGRFRREFRRPRTGAPALETFRPWSEAGLQAGRARSRLAPASPAHNLSVAIDWLEAHNIWWKQFGIADTNPS